MKHIIFNPNLKLDLDQRPYDGDSLGSWVLLSCNQFSYLPNSQHHFQTTLGRRQTFSVNGKFFKTTCLQLITIL